ncbi:hypothetical protein A3C21_02915 [Candidatus Kaiserbacteria bacterium RIFCSPHIGHO2_02_FULL_59_21]|uniref:Uncharacterized protein n=1 Tax=Candidatus Kaiserbacteria bacterium RIFCSPHIGHO2_02_FULL_59_21 TaxID=1798500 RepID=A0A1F6DYV4_9BACT|nr:MAG: hypothetical protein A2766_04025 [Candidatus Kaiserbacteria bacterium RIFCSPHIGHO2_01_FULL_58_22]OGG66615.1 MAG: hypothetical protein A3C21_02915 [Candidatus Kaiserbacteria bacterium RIFCSPHIGHO2_02_FULL_59_21]OGG79010.1 MAG: hypothetical protein A2952_01440 [Candidatus Kaiserbacteria bacterium RIFCSPLOWO2_01_FULL_59_34]OGG84366.1 MAG: hypothetical protein A3I47_01765 [Candidatus Kaiserbacteria bacterium RIFCSPLOWO2_02_FULL_59_19]
MPAGAKIIALDQRRVGLGARGAERYGVSASPSSYKQRDDRRGGGDQRIPSYSTSLSQKRTHAFSIFPRGVRLKSPLGIAEGILSQ